MNIVTQEQIIKFEVRGWNILRIEQGSYVRVYACMGTTCLPLGSYQRMAA